MTEALASGTAPAPSQVRPKALYGGNVCTQMLWRACATEASQLEHRVQSTRRGSVSHTSQFELDYKRCSMKEAASSQGEWSEEHQRAGEGQ